jgi:hypothetical protein
MKISRPMINNFRSHSKGLLLCQVSRGFHFNRRFCEDLYKEEDRHQTMNISKKKNFYITYIELEKLAMGQLKVCKVGYLLSSCLFDKVTSYPCLDQ